MLKLMLIFGVLACPALAQTPASTQTTGAMLNPRGTAEQGEVATSVARRSDARVIGLVPDVFYLPGDEQDDAPSFQRAINAACAGGGRKMDLLSRHYSMRSPIIQSCLVSWVGEGWQEQADGAALRTGTWLDFTAAAFGRDGTTNPITISGELATGSILERFGLTQPVSLPASGDNAWTSPTTPFLILIEQVNGGMEVRDVMCLGVASCIYSHASQRTSFRGIRGQAFRVLIQIDKSFDVGRIEDVHFWPYFSQDARIMTFQQANAVAVLSKRSDTPMMSRLFVLGAYAGLALDASADEGRSVPGGTTTGGMIGSISCDLVRHCLLVTEAASGAQVQVNQIRSFGQRWGADMTAVTSRTGMLADGDVVSIHGPNTTLQIGSYEDFGSGAQSMTLTSPAGASNVQIGSMLVYRARSPANAVLVRQAGSAHGVTINAPPLLTPDAPAGWGIANQGAPGTVSWPDAVKRN